jgi:hypothetical protein
VGFRLAAADLTCGPIHSQDATRNVYDVEKIQEMFMRLASTCVIVESHEIDLGLAALSSVTNFSE